MHATPCAFASPRAFEISRASALLLALVLAATPATARAQQPPGATGEGPDTIPLYDGLGSHHHDITTAVPGAQAYFDQGLRLYYAFNHAEAVRSFRQAQRLDPECAMCWWGEALAWGPNINLPMDSAAGLAAWEAARKAAATREGATPRERAYIDALLERYAPGAPSDRAALDSAYARAMADVAERYPDDDDAAVLYAEALMDLRPWDYWQESGEPAPGIPEALRHLEAVKARTPDHPGGCHFYIHAVEELYPERAVECAERLAALMPAAGHITHMPGHIYIRVGRYRDAIRVNEHAVHADESYIADQRPGMTMYTAGYYPHNYDFMAFAAAMAGDRERAIESAEKVASLIAPEMLDVPGMAFLQNLLTRPLQLRVRFGLWPEILAAEAPPASLHHARGIWHYARGRALAATGDLDAAREELRQLREHAEDPALEGVRLEFNPSRSILGIGAAVLEGRIAEAAGDAAGAVAALEEAVRRESALDYGEPPEWSIPARQELGEALLAAGRAADAERVFQEDLARFPENGWSLRGLASALSAQGREDEAARVMERFREAWGAGARTGQAVRDRSRSSAIQSRVSASVYAGVHPIWSRIRAVSGTRRGNSA